MGTLNLPIPVNWWPSPHCSPGRTTPVDLMVIHAISLPPGIFGTGDVIDFFMGRLDIGKHPYYREVGGMRVSAHFFIERAGTIHQFVDTDDTAWHAGDSQFEGRSSCNDFSIGVELEGTPRHPFTPEQYTNLIVLTITLMERYPLIGKGRIMGHSHIAPQRKVDPGPSFDWDSFLEAIIRRVDTAQG